MNFFNFPAEIRLQIYEELFVRPEPLIFITSNFSSTLPLITEQCYHLCPELLRTSKSVHREASPVLYSGNGFKFIGLEATSRLSTKSAALASFFSQIGRQNASFLRHVLIDFDVNHDDYPDSWTVRQENSIEMVELIRDNCTSISKLETTLNDVTSGSELVAKALELLDTRFKEISSLKEIIVHINCYEDPSDDLKQAMRDCGWVAKITLLADDDVVEEEEEMDYSGEDEEEDDSDEDYITLEIEDDWEDALDYYRIYSSLNWAHFCSNCDH